MLFIGDTAGVNSLFSRCLTKYGNPGTMRFLPRILRPYSDAGLTLSVSLEDPYHHSEYNGAKLYGGRRRFYLLAYLHNLILRFDVLVMTTGTSVRVRDAILRVTPRRVVKIMQYHGSDIRDMPRNHQSKTEHKYDFSWVVTPDLLKYEQKHMVYIPNLVDVDLFYKRPIPQNNCGIVMLKPKQTEEQTLDKLKELGYGDIKWTFVKRVYDLDMIHLFNTRPNHDMPRFLSQYEYYANIYYNSTSTGQQILVTPNTLSNTALQSLSLGLKVIRSDGKVIDRLLEHHHPKSVMAHVDKIIQTGRNRK